MSPKRMEGIRSHISRFHDMSKDLAELEVRAAAAAEGIDMNSAFGRFFSSAVLMEDRAKLAKDSFPEAAAAMLEVASDSEAHRFNILGSGLRDFGTPLNWHSDIRSGLSWPAEMDFLQAGDVAFNILIAKDGGKELKAPWDLSNMYWQMTLACGWHLSSDAKYLKAIERDVSDWISANPPFKGVNWFCAMNVGIRCINIAAALATAHIWLDRGFVRTALKSLYLHGVCISANLEITGDGRKRNNHYLSNLIGLFFLGVLFKDDDIGAQWLKFSKAELELELGLQFRDDGGSVEDSSSYHRLSCELMLLCAMLGDSSGITFSTAFKSRLHTCLSFTRHIIQANGKVPQFGDNDSGRMIPLSGYMRLPGLDHRHILALGGEFFEDDSMRAAGFALGIESMLLLGRFKHPSKRATMAGSSICAFKDSGVYVAKSRASTLVIRNGRINPDFCKGGHSHCDQLSFTFNVCGKDVFVDPGAYMYSCDMEARNDFRSTSYHNTVQIGGAELNFFRREKFGDLWWMEDRASSDTKLFALDSEGVFRFKGSVKSYLQQFGLILKREIAWKPDSGLLRINDSMEGAGKLMAQPAISRFLLAPELSVEMVGSSSVLILKGSSKIARFVVSTSCILSTRSLWHSPDYGIRQQAIQIEARWSSSEPHGAGFEIEFDKDLFEWTR